MNYSIDMIENGFVITKSDMSTGWGAEPQRWAFSDWDSAMQYLKDNMLKKDVKEVVV